MNRPVALAVSGRFRFHPPIEQNMKKTKKKTFISFYQYDIDDPVIVVFDTPEEARKEARKDIRATATNTRDRKEYLAEFEARGSVTIGDVVIYAAECDYRPSEPRYAFVLETVQSGDAMSEREADTDVELFATFEDAEAVLKVSIAAAIADASLDDEEIREFKLDDPIRRNGTGDDLRLSWHSTYLNRRYRVYRGIVHNVISKGKQP